MADPKNPNTLNIPSIPETGYLRLHQIIGCRRRGIPPIIPVSRTAWYDGVRDGIFPAGIKLGIRTTVYPVDAIRDLINKIKEAA